MKKACVLMVGLCALSAAATAAPTSAYPAFSVTELTNSEGTFTTYGGLMKDGDMLYFGNSTYVRTYDLSSSTAGEFAECGSNTKTGSLSKLGSDMYMSMDTSYDSPYPSNYGTIAAPDVFTATVISGSAIGSTTYSIFDSAVYGGNLYFVANMGSYVDDGEGGQEGVTYGTKIWRYNTSTPSSPVEIADIGGASGGLTFDTSGNMYYASQNTGEGVLMFTAAEVATGGLVAADGEQVIDATCGSLAFFSDGSLLAETGYGQLLSVYDTDSGDKICDIASTSGWDYMDKLVVDGDDIYVLSNDWSSYAGTLSVINVPEPMTIALLVSGGAAVLLKRRRK